MQGAPAMSVPAASWLPDERQMGLSGHRQSCLVAGGCENDGQRRSRPNEWRVTPLPTEFYLIIFLLVVMLVFAYFYSKRAQARMAAKQQAEETAKMDTIDS
jgi:hypothetical protein